MTKIRPYVALDIETTGLDVERVQILQIGWVLDDGISPRDQLEKGSILIQNDEIVYGENYAIGMNAWIFQELMKKKADRKYETCRPEDGIVALMRAIEKAANMALTFDSIEGVARPNQRVQIAGKNVGNFDWPIILNNLKRLKNGPPRSEAIPESEKRLNRVDHRFIDCGAVYFDTFGKNPGFDLICKEANIPEINHDALDDAMAVVIALRHKVGINF
jgi:hypothetical protein